MECLPWFEVLDRRKVRFRNVQIKVLLVFEQGRPLQVSTSFDNFDQFGPVSTSFDQFRPVSTSFDQFRPVSTSLDWFISLLITSMIQYFWGGSLLLPTSVISIWHTTYTCSSSASCRAVGNPIPLLICKWFFEISSSQNLFWNLFFVYFKLDCFLCL